MDERLVNAAAGCCRDDDLVAARFHAVVRLEFVHRVGSVGADETDRLRLLTEKLDRSHGQRRAVVELDRSLDRGTAAATAERYENQHEKNREAFHGYISVPSPAGGGLGWGLSTK